MNFRWTTTGLLVGVIAAVSLAAVLFLGGASRSPVEASPGTVVAFDMLTAGNAATTLGPLDGCVEASPGGSVTVDITVDEIPAGSGLAGFNYNINFTATTFTISGQTHTDPAVNLLASAAGSSVVDLSDTPPTSDGSHSVAAVDFGTAEAGPAKGVLGRYTIAVAGAAPAGLYDFTLTLVDLGNDPGFGGGSIPQTAPPVKGQMAVSPTLCPTDQADLKVQTTLLSVPSPATVGTPFDVVVHDIVVHNNGPLAANADVTVALALPSDCTATGGNQVTIQDQSLSASVALVIADQTFSVTCTAGSFHTYEATTSVALDDPSVPGGDPDLTNNSFATSQVQNAVEGTADIGVQSVTVAGPAPPAAPPTQNNPFNVTVDAVLTNSATFNAFADVTVSLSQSGGTDCTFTPAGSQTATNVEVAASPATTNMPTQTWSVTCTQTTDHTFVADVTVNVLTGPGVNHVTGDPNNANDSDSGQVILAVLSAADLKISSVLVTAPASAGVNTAFNVTADVAVHNNGPAGPVNGDASTTLALPADCTTTSTNPQTDSTVALAVSTATQLPQKSWSVTCTQHSDHVFEAEIDISLSEGQPSVADPTPANNSASGSASTGVTADADLKVANITVTAPATAVLNQAFDVKVDSAIHNNGPFGPVNTDVTVSLDIPADCTATPSGAQKVDDLSLAVSASTAIPQKTWSITCTKAVTHTFKATVTVAADELHITDPVTANNTITGTAAATTAIGPSAPPSAGGQPGDGSEDWPAAFAAAGGILALIGAALVYRMRRRQLR